MKNKFLFEMKSRGYLHQCTDFDNLERISSQKSITAYIGFDCTASSLHVGSLLGQMGANSMTDGIYSQHGRLIKSLNKFDLGFYRKPAGNWVDCSIIKKHNRNAIIRI